MLQVYIKKKIKKNHKFAVLFQMKSYFAVC